MALRRLLVVLWASRARLGSGEFCVGCSGPAPGSDSDDEVVCGSVVIATQDDVEAFRCTVVEGALAIQGPGVTDVGGLASLRRVLGSMSVLATGVEDLDGLENLEYVGGALHIAANSGLTTEASFDALGGAAIAGSLDVTFVDEAGATQRASLCERPCGEIDRTSSPTPASEPSTGCQDDPAWFKKGSSEKRCEFVAANPGPRCALKADGAIYAFESCKETCGTCGAVCADSTTWRKDGDASKGCAWVKRAMVRCAVVGSDGTLGHESCRFACGTCDRFERLE